MSQFELAVLRTALPRLHEEREKAINTCISGALDPKAYGYSCGYIQACNDTIKILEEVIEDIQEG